MHPPRSGDRPSGLSPTDISQFIRLEQCERYLRLRLHERAFGTRFMREANATPQSIPPLLTRSGASFEDRIEAAIAERHATRHFSTEDREQAGVEVIERLRELPAGQVLVLFQPRLRALLDGWQLTGDVDLLRAERDATGALRLLIVDMKSSSAVKVEHRLQVAFYHAMLERLLAAAGLEVAEIRTGILYRGGGESDEAQRQAAETWLGVSDAFLELIVDGQSYLDAVADLVTAPGSLAHRVAEQPFEDVPYHLAIRCDGCLYNEFCMRWSAERDDLTLLPHLNVAEKNALLRAGVRTVAQLAALKELNDNELVVAPGHEAIARQLAATWPIGPRLDELIMRARRYRAWKGDDTPALTYIPSKGYSTLPAVDAEHHPNMVWVHLDAQHDYLEDRLYLIGAQVVACTQGAPHANRHVVHLTDGPPATEAAERELLLGWVKELLATVTELAAPDELGQPRAPVHLVFFNRYAMRVLLDALSRHFSTIVGAAPALYDFMTQLAGFDSPIATFLEEEIRELKNYPMVCQSLQSVARFLGFDWKPFTQPFKERLFDHVGVLERDDGSTEWFTRRSRFNSQVPLEYAYAAWGELEAPSTGPDPYAPYRAVDAELLKAFQARRLEAIAHIASDFNGNPMTTKTAFHLPDLAAFSDVARHMAQALDEFVTIERHVELADWRETRHAPPERRVLMGETLLVRYDEADQPEDVIAANREHQRRHALQGAWRSENPGARMTKEQKAELGWSQDGLRVRLRLETDGVDCDLDAALALTTLREGDRVVLAPRWTVDSRLPEAERKRFTPTPKQLLYAPRASLEKLVIERNAAGHAVRAFAEVELQASYVNAQGFAFSAMPRPLVHGERYTLDPSPDNWYGYWCAKVCEALVASEQGLVPGRNAIYERLAHPGRAHVRWPAAAAEGQARFLAGLDAMHAAGAFHDFEPSKRSYIGSHGDAPILLVQGPPGTGKSYSTAFAIFARMQGAMAAGQDFRVFVSCKTHAATDVLLADIVEVQQLLRELSASQPAIFAEHFDARLLSAPLFRLHPREAPPDGVIALYKDASPTEKLGAIQSSHRCVVATPPGGVYRLVKDRWKQDLFGHDLCDCLILDEASQMNLPEAAMAGLLLRQDGQFVVVGDHRQMPPIVKHDWSNEPRRTFREYRAYESLFLTLLPLNPPVVKFEESFRLHAAMAEFLRREIYDQDGIRYHSKRQALLPSAEVPDPFVAAVLSPAHPLVVVVHDEGASQTRNAYEQALITPLIDSLTSAFGLDADKGLGVVVPHRAQRAALQLAFPCLGVLDTATGEVSRWAIDTVERFQGGERTAILISATESDHEYLLAAGEFLMDPRRLTVALSRAKNKLVLVAARSVFSLFSPNEETFANAQLWKHLLRRTCSQLLWEGEREGHHVEVWGN